MGIPGMFSGVLKGVKKVGGFTFRRGMRPLGKMAITKGLVPGVELVFLGPMGPLMCGMAIGAVQTAVQIPSGVVHVVSHKNPVTMVVVTVKGVWGFWKRVRTSRKLLLIYGFLHGLNGPARRAERSYRAAGVVALRRLDGSGVGRFVSAIQDPFLFKLLAPSCIQDDQDWVIEQDSWTNNFSREKETAHWLNTILSVVWPYVDAIAAQAMVDIVEPLIAEQLADQSTVTNVEFAQFSLGNLAPTVEQYYVHDVNPKRPEELLMDADVHWFGNPDIVLAVTGKFIAGIERTFNVALTNLEFKGKFRIAINPLLDVLPVVGGTSIMMVQEPYINYEVRLKSDSGGQGLSLDNIPLLKGTIIQVITGLISDALLFPNCIPIPIASDAPGTEKGSLEKSLQVNPVGVLKVEVLKASNVIAADFGIGGIGGKSDPYARVGLGLSPKSVSNKSMKKTKVISSTLNPVWNETFELDLYDLNLQKLVIRVYDEDFGSDDLLGELLLTLDTLEHNVPKTMTYALRGPGGVAKKNKDGSNMYGTIDVGLTFIANAEMQQRIKRASEQPAAEAAAAKAAAERAAAEAAVVQVEKKSLVQLLKETLLFHFAEQEDFHKEFKRDIARKLLVSIDDGSLSKYLLKDKGTLSRFDDERIRAFGRYMPISFGVHSGVPPWVFNPSFGTLQNFDQLLLQIWPHLEHSVNHLITRFSNEKLNETFIPESMRNLVKCRMIFEFGELPPLMECIRVYAGKDRDMIVEFAVKVAGDQVMGGEVEFAHSPFCKQTFVVSQMQFVGNFRLRLRPLVPMVPIVAGMSLSIMGSPIWDASVSWKFSPLLPAIDMCNVPGFRLIRWFITNKIMRPLMIHPCCLHMPVLDMSHPAVKYHIQRKEPVTRVLSVKIIEAKNLQVADAMSQTSDPFAVMVYSGAGSFGARSSRTPTVNNTLTPVWNYQFDFETETDDLLLAIGIFDSDISAEEEEKLALKARKTRTVRKSALGSKDNRKLNAIMGELETELKASRQMRDKFSVELSKIPFSAFMNEYVLSETPEGTPPSTFKKFTLGVLDIIEEETLANANRMPKPETGTHKTIDVGAWSKLAPYRGDERQEEEKAEREAAEAKDAAEDPAKKRKSEEKEAPKVGVEAPASMGCDLQFLLETEVVKNGNDCLGVLQMEGADLPEDLKPKEMWMPLVKNPDLSENPSGQPMLKISLQWMLLASKTGDEESNRPPTLGTLTVYIINGENLIKKLGAGEDAGRVRPVVAITVGDETKVSTPGDGPNPIWGGDHDKFTFNKVDPTLAMGINASNTKRSMYKKMTGKAPSELGGANVSVMELAKLGEFTETYVLDSKHGKGKVTIKTVWREIMGEEGIQQLSSPLAARAMERRESMERQSSQDAERGSAWLPTVTELDDDESEPTPPAPAPAEAPPALPRVTIVPAPAVTPAMA